MAFANIMQCYVCDHFHFPRRTVRLIRDDNIDFIQIAGNRRQAAGFPVVDIFDNTRICTYCNISITNELRNLGNNNNYLRLNVLLPAISRSCILCESRVNLQRVTLKYRVDIFVACNICVPDF